jgi:hypothetical protein
MEQRRPIPPRGPHRSTKLQRWLDDNGVPSAHVEAKLAERLHGRAPSRRQFLRWRLGRVEPKRDDMVRILWAAREVAHNPHLEIHALFDFDPDAEEIWLL